MGPSDLHTLSFQQSKKKHLDTGNSDTDISVKDIARHCTTFKGAELKKSIFQLTTTTVLFLISISLMIYFLNINYFITAILAFPSAGLLTRLFIFQHDCGHGSFFNSQKANNWTGRFLSILTFTPFDFWRRAHNMHHAGSGNLDRRSIGGIDTITVKEYKKLPDHKKLIYKLYRNPIILILIGTPFYVIFLQRVPFKQSTYFHDDYQYLRPGSVWKSFFYTNVSILVAYFLISQIVGYSALLVVYFPVLVITAWIGGALFYVQHQFEDTYWEHNEKWTSQEAALLGSSYYELPKALQWFTGNIGFHHIHHLCSKIPNYKLQECMDALPVLYNINRLSLGDIIKCMHCKLWDEDKGKMVTIHSV